MTREGVNPWRPRDAHVMLAFQTGRGPGAHPEPPDWQTAQFKDYNEVSVRPYATHPVGRHWLTPHGTPRVGPRAWVAQVVLPPWGEGAMSAHAARLPPHGIPPSPNLRCVLVMPSLRVVSYGCRAVCWV